VDDGVFVGVARQTAPVLNAVEKSFDDVMILLVRGVVRDG
jgi:hypothetical protein